jgi:hypothetical protein
MPIAAKVGVAKVAVAKRVETRHPLHIPVIAGISAGLYAGCLFVTSGLQFAADRALIADRQPLADAITLLQQDHEAMTAALQAATDRYNEAVDGYGALTSDRVALQARLARLGRQVAAIEGITIIGPSLDWSTSVVQSPSRSTTAKASGGTSKGATTTAPAAATPAPTMAAPAAAAPAPAPVVVRAPAPAPVVAATTGASGKP